MGAPASWAPGSSNYGLVPSGFLRPCADCERRDGARAAETIITGCVMVGQAREPLRALLEKAIVCRAHNGRHS